LILLAFIIEKNLDTPTLPLLTFAQKVSAVLPPLELFSLERKGHLLPGGLFVCGVRRSHLETFSPRRHGEHGEDFFKVRKKEELTPGRW
jgi:hypothetical protein